MSDDEFDRRLADITISFGFFLGLITGTSVTTFVWMVLI
jgi:hypothetical protein